MYTAKETALAPENLLLKDKAGLLCPNREPFPPTFLSLLHGPFPPGTDLSNTDVIS